MKYLKSIVGIGAALAISACATTVQTGGAGVTSKGEPVSGLLVFDQATRMFDINVVSPGAWTCSSRFQQSDQGLQQRSVPLTCDNGWNGTIVMTRNEFQQQMVGSFRLTDGTAGQVTFGLT